MLHNICIGRNIKSAEDSRKGSYFLVAERKNIGTFVLVNPAHGSFVRVNINKNGSSQRSHAFFSAISCGRCIKNEQHYTLFS